MGTRFLATQESDFAPLWKEGIVNAEDRGTLIARGFVGPARWIRTTVSKEHQKNTLEHTPELFLDTPGPWTEGALKLIENEIKAKNKELARFETIKKFVILPEALDQDEGEVTATQKVKRKAVTEKFEDQLEALYAQS